MEEFHDKQMSLQAKITNSFQRKHDKRLCRITTSRAWKTLHYLSGYFTSKLCDLVEDSFYDRRVDFLDFLETFKAKGATQDDSTSGTTLPVIAQPTNVLFQSLPKIDLPKFSGKFSDWENFSYVFRSIIHRRENLSITNDNYDRTWTSLVEYYENQRRIVGSHIAEISVKYMKSDISNWPHLKSSVLLEKFSILSLVWTLLIELLH